MWFKHRAWIPVAWGLSVINLVAVWFAAQPAEPFHATGHALLAAGFALGARHLMTRRRDDRQTEHSRHAIGPHEPLQQDVGELQSRLLELEERLDFTERMLATQRDADRLGARRPDA